MIVFHSHPKYPYSHLENDLKIDRIDIDIIVTANGLGVKERRGALSIHPSRWTAHQHV